MTNEPSTQRSAFRFDPFLVLVAIFTLFALGPLFAPGYFFEAHDGRHSVFFLMQFDASIRDGALFPRWAMHHIQGYGYPTFIIQAPLGFYLAEFFVLLGAGYTLAAKLTWVTGFLLSAWGMFQLTLYWLTLYAPGARKDGETHLRNRTVAQVSALVAAVMYVYVPYHLLDIYVRAALNDALLLAWFPWVFLAFDRLIDRGLQPGWQFRLALAILSLGGLLLTHTFALLSFTPLLIAFVLFRLSQRARRAVRTGEENSIVSALTGRTALALSAGVLSLLLTAAFLFPLLREGVHLEQQVYVTDTYNYRSHFVWLGQFFSPFWGFGFSDDPSGSNDGMGFQLGLMAVLFTTTAVFALWRPGVPRFWNGMLSFLVAATLLTLFLVTPASAPVWSTVPALGVIQFPWRLLALTAFTMCATSGIVAALLLSYASDSLTFPVVPALASALAPAGVQPLSGGLALTLLVVFAAYSFVQAELQPVEPWREDGRAVFRFEEEHPDMIAYTEWVAEPFTESPMSDDYRRPDYVENWSDHGILTRLAIAEGTGSILSQYSRGSSGGGVVEMQTPGVVRIHELYFPGWRVAIDGEPTTVDVSQPHGLMEVQVSAGVHRVDARMSATPARTAGTVVSWSILLFVLGIVVWGYLRRETGTERD